MVTTNSKVTNLAYLKELAKGDMNFINDMVTLFLEQTPDAISKLEKSCSEKDWKTLRFVAHKMKPSFSFVGLNELSDKVNSVEEYSENEIHLNRLPEMIADIKSVCSKAIEELTEQKKEFQV